MRRLLTAAMVWLMLLTGTAMAEEPSLSISAPGEEIRPGRPVVISFTVPEEGDCDVFLQDTTGMQTHMIAAGRRAAAGYNSLYWNGTSDGIPVPAGEWRLTVRMNGAEAETPVTVGTLIPCLISPRFETDTVEEGDTVLLSYYSTEPGTLMLQEGDGTEPLYWENAEAGSGEISFQAAMSVGEHRLSLTLAGEDGTLSEAVTLVLNVLEKPDPNAIPTPEPLPAHLKEKAENGFTPAHTSDRRGQDDTLNYWTLPMDITDEESVWKVLTSPITVVDSGKRNAEKTQVIIRSLPREDSDGVGMVTCVSQGVHVLERGEYWSRIECYSSSFHDSPILNWNALVQGYVPTAYLKTLMPSQELGLVVDKLTQRLYVFREGRLFATLLVSTGISNAKQPYNETRSGEFLLVSKVGEFASDNLRCAMALRFNDGDLLHEVPYISSQGGRFRDYSINEPKLGTKASHGCIRVQRQASPEGVSQKWLWNNYRKNTRILIWEDWQGRQIEVPDSGTELYCLRKKTGYYHTSDKCSQIRGKKTDKLTYGQLESEEYLKLKPCPACAAPLREGVIRKRNLDYAEGGDHDPIMTEARKKCPRKLKGK